MLDSQRGSCATASVHAYKPDTEVILEELTRILESSVFRGSERSKHFLQFVVHQTVEGKTENLKERVIGVEVFGRPADYETAGDAIVRVKANEVRKRLAQYYAESAARSPIRIELSPGSYHPRFLPNQAEQTDRSLAFVSLEPANPVESKRRSSAAKWLAGIAVAILLAASGWWLSLGRASDFDRFWSSTLSGPGTPVIYLGTSTTFRLKDSIARQLDEAARSPNPKPIAVMPGDWARLTNYHVSMGNLNAVMQLAAVLQSRGRPAELRPGGELNLEDMSGRPVILIGAYSNAWTIETNARLRFRFGPDGHSIYDSLDSKRVWSLNKIFPWEPQTIDYAIVSRVWDSSSGSVFITVAGVNVFGTQIAGEFLTKPEYWKALAHRLPPGWEKKNLQVVLETAVLDNIPSTPKVVGTHVW